MILFTILLICVNGNNDLNIDSETDLIKNDHEENENLNMEINTKESFEYKYPIDPLSKPEQVGEIPIYTNSSNFIDESFIHDFMILNGSVLHYVKTNLINLVLTYHTIQNITGMIKMDYALYGGNLYIFVVESLSVWKLVPYLKTVLLGLKYPILL